MSDVLGPGQRNVQTTRIVEKADALVLVGTHARQYDEVLLATLERIDAGHLDFLYALVPFINQCAHAKP